MSEFSALQKLWDAADEGFFRRNPSRSTHIRTAFERECEAEFRTLGPHERNRRRILLWRPPPGHPAYKQDECPLLRTPFLLLDGETVEDRDDILLRVINEIMQDAKQQHSV